MTNGYPPLVKIHRARVVKIQRARTPVCLTVPRLFGLTACSCPLRRFASANRHDVAARPAAQSSERIRPYPGIRPGRAAARGAGMKDSAGSDNRVEMRATEEEGSPTKAAAKVKPAKKKPAAKKTAPKEGRTEEGRTEEAAPKRPGRKTVPREPTRKTPSA